MFESSFSMVVTDWAKESLVDHDYHKDWAPLQKHFKLPNLPTNWTCLLVSKELLVFLSDLYAIHIPHSIERLPINVSVWKISGVGWTRFEIRLTILSGFWLCVKDRVFSSRFMSEVSFKTPLTDEFTSFTLEGWFFWTFFRVAVNYFWTDQKWQHFFLKKVFPRSKVILFLYRNPELFIGES